MKKIFTFCVSLLAALSVFAYDFQSGDLFYNITSSSAPYTVEVTQQSQYYNSNYSGVDTIVIPETVTYNAIIYSVTSIGESAFNNSKLTTITIPNTVTSIGEYAFAYCQKLTSVAIGSGVKTIHMAAFNNCYALRSITIPANVKEIYNQAFTGASISTIYMEGTTPPSLLQSKSDGSVFRIFTTTPTCYVPCSAVASYKASTKWKGAVREFVAEFPYIFTIASANTSLGTIAITQQPDCSTAAIFEAIPNTGCYFTQWSDGNTDNPRTLKVIQDTRLTASFASSTYVVNLIAGANGAVSGAGTYDHGTTATITAIPNDGYHFTQWSDGNTDNPRSIVVVEPISLTALFEENYTQEHCQIIYTSTDGDVVTPWVTYNFGADIVSNTYADGQGVITFDGPVIAIGDTAFANCSSLESIIIPDRVTVIGDQAFQYCTYLKDVTIGNRVESIGTAAFNNCSSLQSIIIPQSVEYIYNYAFLGTSVKTVYVNCTNPPLLNPNREDPDLVFMTNAVNTCYIPCGKLESYQVSNWKTKSFVREFIERPSYALLVKSSNNAMGKAIITQDINCESLTAIITAIPNDGYHFTQWSDGNTDNPRTLTITTDTTLIAEFEKNAVDPTWQITYTSTDGNIVTPYATDVFGANIVSNTYENGQGVITFDGPVMSIGDDGFKYCTSLTSITIPNSVTSIGNSAFSGCSCLTSITIPKNVTSISPAAFWGCPNLAAINVDNNNLTYDSRGNCNAIIETAINTLLVGCQNTIIPNTIVTIGEDAFRDCKHLTSIVIPNSVKTISGWAFFECTSLTSITIPESVINIGKLVFYGCSSLATIHVDSNNAKYDSRNNCNAIVETATNTLVAGCKNTVIPNDIEVLGLMCFTGCDSLRTISIPESVNTIGNFAFSRCYILDSIRIGSNVTTIGDSAFYECFQLSSIVIPNSVHTIGEMAFRDCTLLNKVILGDNVTTIGDEAFRACATLGSIIIPKTVVNIGLLTFAWCSSLDTIHVEATTPPTLSGWGGGTFYSTPLFTCYIPCGTLAAYQASDWAQYVSEFIEEGCIDPTWQITYTSTDGNIVTPYKTNVFGANIVSNEYKDDQGVITFDGPVTSIGEEAFHECSSLASITIPNSVTSIGNSAFNHCSGLTSITIPNSVTSIGIFAFDGCSSLTSITCEATTPPTLDFSVFPSELTTAYIPCGTKETYEESAWGTYSITSFIEEDCPEPIDPTWQITYTSTDGNIVTPNATDVFGANIVSNTYQDGQGVITFDGPVTSIGDYAFFDCKFLASITIPNGVTSIGDWAFSGCSSLTSITIPNSVTSIGELAFYNCSSLASVTIGNSVMSIEYCTFQGCSSLTSIALPNSVRSIGRGAFLECSSLTSITISDSVTSIGNEAFSLCTSLTSITIPNSVESIEVGAFWGCSSLVSMAVKSGNTTYDSRENCNAIIETVTNSLIAGCQNTIVPSSITSIGDGAFSDCSSLTSITIPNSVTSIGESAFTDCSSLTSITCEATTPPTLGSYVFPFQLTTAYIPCGTKETYEESAWGTYSITSFIEGDCPEPIDPTWQILYTSIDSTVVTPYKTDVFGANIVSNEYKDGQGVITFDGPVTSIGDLAFYSCTSITSIAIPNGVTSIGQYAFRDCSFLISITIPNSITSIGWGAFQSCSTLTSITIPNNVTSIGKQAFWDCSKLTSITIPNSVTSIGDHAFYRCTSLVSVAIGNSVESIEWGTFQYCYSLTSIVIPDSVTSIGYEAFFGCSSLTSITIPNSVTSIGEYAFRSCSLTSITIPNSITSIGYLAFLNCSYLDSIYVEATTPPVLGSDVFEGTPSPVCIIPCGSLSAYEASAWASQVSEFIEEGCPTVQKCGDNLYWEYADGVLTITGTGEMFDYAKDTDVPWYDVRGNIKTVSLPDAMTKIGQNAFYKCTAMTTINMPTSLTAIGEKAFAQDTKLACEIILPASMTTIASRAFFNCKAVPAFHVEATTPPIVQADAFDYTTAPIHVPCGYGHIYGKHTQWGMLNLEMCELLQDNVYYYPIDGHTARAVTYQSNPTDTIVIPSAVVIDGMPRTVTEVADFAFTDCANLPAIYFNEGLEYIGERAFVRCYGLQGTIVLPATLETIGERAFSYCNSVTRYTLQSMTPPALGDGAFTCANHDALFYVSCEVMDDYKVATNWSSLKSRLRDACLNIYHYNTPLGANGVYTTEDTLVASIYYRRKFTPYRWETLYLPFEVDRVTVLEEGVEYDLTAWDIVNGGHYFLAKPDGMLNKEILFGFTDELESHTPYIIQFSDAYYTDKLITFYGKESWHKLSTSFEVLSSSSWMQIAGNTTMQDQLLEKPVYMLRSGLDFILQKTTTTLHPFECYVMPYATPSGTPARMNVRFRGDVPTDVESVKGNESHLTYTVDGYTLTVYPQGQAFSIYSLNGALIYSCEAGKEAVDCELNSGCYLLHAGAEAHKIML